MPCARESPRAVRETGPRPPVRPVRRRVVLPALVVGRELDQRPLNRRTPTAPPRGAWFDAARVAVYRTAGPSNRPAGLPSGERVRGRLTWKREADGCMHGVLLPLVPFCVQVPAPPVSGVRNREIATSGCARAGPRPAFVCVVVTTVMANAVITIVNRTAAHALRNVHPSCGGRVESMASAPSAPRLGLCISHTRDQGAGTPRATSARPLPLRF